MSDPRDGSKITFSWEDFCANNRKHYWIGWIFGVLSSIGFVGCYSVMTHRPMVDTPHGVCIMDPKVNKPDNETSSSKSP